MVKGRPTKSAIRQNIVDMLFLKKPMHGYEIYKHYCELFPEVTSRVIYYNLKKGVFLKEFIIQEVRDEKGEYSWGNMTTKIYYILGPKANPTNNKKLREYFNKISKEKKI